jgi:urease subunit beta
VIPGEILPAPGVLTVNAGMTATTITVTNTSTRPVRVSSLSPFWRANPRLEFDRAASIGCRLDVLAGSSVRWAPGETKEVRLVRFAPNARTITPGGEHGR